MVTKSEILNIDYTGNTCTVRMPLFESSGGGNKAISTAIFANPPGVYNGYKIGDIVLVAFDDGLAQKPCVIGKLYLGAAQEALENGSSINCTNLKASANLTLPLATKIESSTDGIQVEGSPATYKTILELLTTIQTMQNTISSLEARVEKLEKE